jgi:hypothetical protein
MSGLMLKFETMQGNKWKLEYHWMGRTKSDSLEQAFDYALTACQIFGVQ